MARKKRFKKLFVEDDCSEWVWAQVIDAKRHVELEALMDRLFVKNSKRGVPWKCLLSRAILSAAKADKMLFDHPVLLAYTEGAKVFILARASTKNAHEHPLCICYRHNFTRTLRPFDEMTKAQFLEHFGERNLQIRLSPPIRHQRDGQAFCREQLGV